MKPLKYAVEYIRTGYRVEFLTESEAVKYYKKLKNKKVISWIIDIYK